MLYTENTKPNFGVIYKWKPLTCNWQVEYRVCT